MEEVCIVVLSCDKYDDCWDIFKKLFEKYWPDCPYNIYLATETKKYDGIETISINEPIWTTRIRKTLETLKTKYVIILLDDFFIRNPVNQEKIEYCINNFDQQTVTFNFELEYSNNIEVGLNGFKLRPRFSPYLHSCQPGIWNREKLINHLSIPQSPWDWETMSFNSEEKFYINSSKNPIIDIGYYSHNKFSIVRGKWAREIVSFFDKEGIEIDYQIRGFYD